MTVEPIEHELVVRCSPERAFETFASRMADWWDPRYTADGGTLAGITVEPRVGGAVVERHDGGAEYEWGRVTAWEPGSRFAHTSTLAQARDAPSQITVRFAQHEDGCAVRFAHGGWNERNGGDRAKFGDWPLLLARFVELAEMDGA